MSALILGKSKPERFKINAALLIYRNILKVETQECFACPRLLFLLFHCQFRVHCFHRIKKKSQEIFSF